jgi:hypothetical protein
MPAIVMSPARRFFVARLFPWFVVLAGVAAAYIGVETMRAARESLTWPAVDGRVIRTSIQTERSSRDSATAGSVTYRPVVVYAFSVNGATHEGQRVSFGEYATADEADARRVVEEYSVGRTVRVYYQPDDPGQAVLRPGLDGVPWFFLVIGGVFVLMGLLFVMVFPRVTASTIRA